MGIAILELHDKQGDVVAYSKVSDCRWHDLSRHAWWLTADGYACSTIRGKSVMMHRYLCQAEKNTIIDHMDGDRLNNIDDNIHEVTRSQNSQNRKSQSRYVGVQKCHNKYIARIHKDHQTYYSKPVDTRNDAAIAYNKLALEHYGDRARMNDLSCGSGGQVSGGAPDLVAVG